MDGAVYKGMAAMGCAGCGAAAEPSAGAQCRQEVGNGDILVGRACYVKASHHWFGVGVERHSWVGLVHSGHSCEDITVLRLLEKARFIK